MRGRIAELQDLVRYGRFRWAVSPALLSTVYLIFTIVATIAVGILLFIGVAHHNSAAATATLVIDALIFIAAISVFRLRRASRSRLLLIAVGGTPKKDWIAISTLGATILILAATVVGVIYAAK